MVTESGKKKIVTDDELKKMSTVGGESSARAKLSARKQKQQSKVNDIFGDFFGFGPNPPGCLAKNTQPVDVKKEKERFIQLLSAEAKRYDV